MFKKKRRQPERKRIIDHIPWYARPFASFIKKVDIGDGRYRIEYHLSNVKINHALSPIYAIIIWLTLHFFYSTSLVDALILSAISTGFYYWTSIFFQPDLDQPARLHLFPLNLEANLRKRKVSSFIPFLGRVGNFRLFEFLHLITGPLRFVWSMIWIPFASFFTHRGVIHWPLIGVWLRVYWLVMIHFIVLSVMSVIGVEPTWVNGAIHYWCMAFFPWSYNFGGKVFLMYCFPVYISDFFHSLVDYLESKNSGNQFCGPSQKRGLFVKAYRFCINGWKEVVKRTQKFDQ
ncbi:DUF2227 family putative metal-binding protein [Bdellovibrio sp. BCCA]|uniref:DUF2227 family putative metal-binding protein n=1 Tax=Bdellovibrio sp. BCCA TaxID=3136281 RepID=UPI0030F1E99C